MKERELNNEESFDLIVKMIHNIRTNVRAKINSSILLVWGYVLVCVSVILFFIKTSPFNFKYSSLLWLLIPLICYPASVYLSRKEETPEKTYLDRLINQISILFIVVCATLPFSTLDTGIPIFFIEGLLTSMWIIIIGLLVKYRSVVWGGIAGTIVSHLLLFIKEPNYQILVFAVVAVISIIIPGHLFKLAISKNKH